MKVRIEMTIDLGDQGTRQEELLDVATLVDALQEATVWHGRPVSLTVREGMWLGSNLWSYAGPPVAAFYGSGLHGVREFVEALGGVEWGGK